MQHLNFSCRICGNQSDHPVYTVKEFMFSTHEEFLYVKCSDCGCLQIVEFPSNIGDYYDSKNYYSFSIEEKESLKSSVSSFLLKNAYAHRIDHFNFIGLLAIQYNKYYLEWNPWIIRPYIDFSSAILDVGCGNGFLLRKMHNTGFNRLTGIDPFIAEDIYYSAEGFSVYKKDLLSFDGGKYDFIMLHHSFEHMPNPHEVLSKAYDLLSDDGTLLIRIPLCDSYAWERYTVNWFQIDAPRHFFLHTKQSMELLAKKHHFLIDKILYDSSYSQFILSEANEKNIPWSEMAVSKPDMLKMTAKTQCLNKEQKGDQACFFLRK